MTTPDPGPAPDPEREGPGVGGPAQGATPLDPVTALGLAVVLAALAGISALIAQEALLGALRLLAGVLAGTAVGAAVLALPGQRPARTVRGALAAAVALALSLALTVPGILSTRLGDLAEHARGEVAALAAGEVVFAPPTAEAPVLIRRSDGSGQLLGRGRLDGIPADPEDVLALSADGRSLTHTRGQVTELFEIAPGHAPRSRGDLPGEPLALVGEMLVLRSCEGEGCYLSGFDLADLEQPRWVVSVPSEARGPDPAGIDLDLDVSGDQEPTSVLGAARVTGALPAVVLRFEPAQGWVDVDPETGFPRGRVLAPADRPCRIAATPAPAAPASGSPDAPLVLTVCAQEDGSLRAAAHRDGEPLWESADSPPGTWSVRLDQGRVLATGTEEGTQITGEILASEEQAEWTAPGQPGLSRADPLGLRVGIDGTAIVGTHDIGQLVGYDTAGGRHLWTLPLEDPASLRGTLAAGTAVVLDPVRRERPLDPRGAQRLRVLDSASGAVSVDLLIDQEVVALHPLGHGRALVTSQGRSLLLGP